MNVIVNEFAWQLFLSDFTFSYRVPRATDNSTILANLSVIGIDAALSFSRSRDIGVKHRVYGKVGNSYRAYSRNASARK